MSNVGLSVLYIQRTIHGIPLSEIVRTLLYQALHLNPPVVLALPGSEVFVTILTSRVSCMHLFWGIFWSALGFPICILPLVSLLVLLFLGVLHTSAGECALPLLHFNIRRNDFCSKILFTVSFCYSKIDLLLPPFAPLALDSRCFVIPTAQEDTYSRKIQICGLTLSLLQVLGCHISTTLSELTG